MAISTTAVRVQPTFQNIGSAGYQEVFWQDALVAGSSQIRHGLVRVLGFTLTNVDGSTGGLGGLDNGDGTITITGVGTATVQLVVRGY